MATNSEEIEALKLRVKDLEARLARLESVLRVGPGPELTLQAQKINVKADAAVAIHANAIVNIDAGGFIELKAGLIKLN